MERKKNTHFNTPDQQRTLYTYMIKFIIFKEKYILFEFKNVQDELN